MKCKRCGKNITRNSITGYCRYCNHYFCAKKYKEKKKKNHLCLNCGKKVEPIIQVIKDNNGKVIEEKFKYPLRCYKCRKKINDLAKKNRKILKERMVK